MRANAMVSPSPWLVPSMEGSGCQEPGFRVLGLRFAQVCTSLRKKGSREYGLKSFGKNQDEDKAGSRAIMSGGVPGLPEGRQAL